MPISVKLHAHLHSRLHIRKCLFQHFALITPYRHKCVVFVVKGPARSNYSRVPFAPEGVIFTV